MFYVPLYWLFYLLGFSFMEPSLFTREDVTVGYRRR